MSTGLAEHLEDGGVQQMASAIRSGLHRASQQALATPTRQADAALGDLVSTTLAELPCAWALITGQDEEVRVRVDGGLAALGAPDQEWYFLLQAVIRAGTVWAGQVPGGHGVIKGPAHLWYGAVLLPGPLRLVAVAAVDELLRDATLAALMGLAGLITAFQESRGGGGQSLTAVELFADLGAHWLAARRKQSIETLAREHLQVLRLYVPFDFAALFSIHGSQAVLSAVLDSQEGPGQGSRVVPLGASPLLQVAATTQQRLMLRDVERNPHWSALPFVARQIRASMVLPTSLGDQTPGVVTLGWSAPADAAQVDMRLAAGFGRWLAAVLLHARGLAADQAVAMLSLTVPIADAPAGGLANPSLLGSFLGSVRQLMSCDGVAVCAWRDGRPELEAALGMALSDDTPRASAPPQGDPFEVTPGLPKWVDIRQAACTPILTQTGQTPAALLLIPLAEDEGFLRSIVLAYQDPHWPTAERFAMAEAVGRYTLSLLHGDRLTDQLFRRYRLQAQLQDLTLELGRTLSFQEMFRILTRRLPAFVPARWLGLYRSDPSGRRLSLFEQAWLDERAAVQSRLLPLIEDLWAMASLAEGPLYFPDAPFESEGGVTRVGTVIVPVRVAEQTIAMLWVLPDETNGFTEVHLGVLSSLASAIGLAFRNAQLFEMVEGAKRDWERTFDAISDMLAIVSLDQVVLRTNKTFAEERGIHPRELVGKPCYEALYQRDTPCPDCPMDRAVANRAVATAEVRHGRTNALHRVEIFPDEDEDGRIMAVVEVAKDITLSRRLQNELVRSERLRALGEMASGMAHDFNNILTAVLGQTELLLHQVPDPEVRRSLGVIAQAAGDAAVAVQRIRDFTQTARQEELALVSLDQLLRDAVGLSAPEWKHSTRGRGRVIRMVEAFDAKRDVLGNPAELRQVFLNILLNAVEAMPQGGTITLRTWNDDDYGSASLTDTGVGMSEETRQRIFDPFFTTRGTAGTGLGMSVGYGIVRRHGGEIEVESELGQGTTVTVRLPLAEPAQDVVAGDQEAAPSSLGLRILVVEDDERLCDLLAQILEVDRHCVTKCRDGAAAKQLLLQETFDLVFTDLSMPEVSGWDVAAAAAALTPKPLVVLVTGWGAQMNERELATGGVDALLPKPFTLAAIRQVVASLKLQRMPQTQP